MDDLTPFDHHDGAGDFLLVPPLDPDFDMFPDDGAIADDFPFNVDFDFTFDDLSFADNLLLEQPESGSDPCFDPVMGHAGSDLSTDRVTEKNSVSDNDLSEGVVRVYDCATPEANQGPISSESSNFGAKSRCESPEIGSCKSNSDVFSTNSSDRDVSSSLVNNGEKLGQKVKVEGDKIVKAKRKKEARECDESIVRSSKFQKSSERADEPERGGGDSGDCADGGDDPKRKARLMRNRESAQLSRQRKKQYVEELEDKVKAMHHTITELKGQISYFMAANTALHQQLTGAVPVPPPGPGMYPAVGPMPYPWMPCPPPPYMMKQGSSVLVPIPRMKPLAPAPAPKASKKVKTKVKTKKVASVSLFGLLFFMLLFGGLLPMVNVRYGSGKSRGVGDVYGSNGKVFVVDKKLRQYERALHESNLNLNVNVNMNGSIGGNTSEPMVASLYVPRNDKMVKIDGNLIIHSVLASEKAMKESSKSEENEGKVSEETGLAIHGSSYPPYPTPGPGSNNWRQPHLDRNLNRMQAQKALGSGSVDGFTPVGSEGNQWFREGLAGPMLSSGMCTEVFQFDISSTPGSIVPASSMNISSKDRQNSTHPSKPKSRRILHVPFDDHTFNSTEEQVQPHEQNDGLQSNKSSSPMIVSVLVDPREVGDGDGEGVIRSKTLPRIFVVVLIDSVKYVTYSCMLPFMGSSSHLTT